MINELFKCNFCEKEYDVEDGYFVYGKYFVCLECFNKLELLMEVQFDSETVSESELKEYLHETNLDDLGYEQLDFEDLGFAFEKLDAEEAELYRKELALYDAENNKNNKNDIEGFEAYHPKSIKEYLDQYVIGQEEAKKIISTAFFNHLVRILNEFSESEDDTEIPKSNVILIGETGTGKTLLCQTLAKLFNLPFVSVDVSNLTQVGWKGADVNDIIADLLRAAEGNVEKAQIGIVLLDEIDKMAIQRGGNEKDINGRGVQQNLLKMLEGGKVKVEMGMHKDVEVETKNILFIGAGAFSGMDEVINKRMNNKSTVGFGGKLKEEKTNIMSEVDNDDIVKYGFMPEFVGRFPVIAKLNKLSEDDLVRIIKEPKNSILNQYIKLFKSYDIDLKVNDDVLKEVAEKAVKNGTGARALKTVIEKMVRDLMFELPGSEIKEYEINKENVGEF